MAALASDENIFGSHRMYRVKNGLYFFVIFWGKNAVHLFCVKAQGTCQDIVLPPFSLRTSTRNYLYAQSMDAHV
jgi:hypothetical protein